MKELVAKIKEAAYLEGTFVTRSGKTTSYYIDKYQFETRPDILEPLGQELAKLFPDPDSYDRIAAPELGAVPIASVVSIVVKKPFVIIKKATKEYGTSKLIEGFYKAGESVVMLEDIMTTGGAVLRACEIAEQAGLNVNGIIGIVNREEGAIENIQSAGYNVKALMTSSELKASK